MSVKQIKWILNKALLLIYTYENRKLAEKDYQKMTKDAKKVVKDARENEYCRKIMLDVLECFDSESKGD